MNKLYVVLTLVVVGLAGVVTFAPSHPICRPNLERVEGTMTYKQNGMICRNEFGKYVKVSGVN